MMVSSNSMESVGAVFPQRTGRPSAPWRWPKTGWRAELRGWLILIGLVLNGKVFCLDADTVCAVIGSIFINLYPNLMVSSTNGAYNLTVNNSASGSYALKVMTVVAILFVPLVLAYQGWTFHVFRARVKAPPTSDQTSPDPAPPLESAGAQ